MAFYVEDGYNTSYIDSLLIALFYKPTHLYELLTDIPENIKFSYLQDMISHNLVEQVRKNYSINASIINEIRNYSLMCGWKSGSSITDLYNVTDYLDFLLTGFSCNIINIETLSYNIKLNYLTFNAKNDSNIKILLDNWISENINKQTYHFVELPTLIPINIKRENENCKIDIKKRIQFDKNNNKSQSSASWVIHSILCYSRVGIGRYYSVIYTTYDNWYLFSNEKLPSMQKIDIKDQNISEKIKQECVLMLYRIDEMLCIL